MLKFILFLFVLSCQTKGETYRHDLGFKLPAESNSFEFPVRLNGYVCQDITGKSGLCYLRIKEGGGVILELSSRMYTYNLALSCTDKLDVDKTFYVEKGKDFTLAITDSGLSSFGCIGEIFPEDRKENISSKFEFRVKVVSKDYIEKNSIHLDGDKLSLGNDSLYSKVYNSGEVVDLHMLPLYEIKDDGDLYVETESYIQRVETFYKKGEKDVEEER